MSNKKQTSIQFTNNNGNFKVINPDLTSYLYFPLANESGMMSSITPELKGDAKTSNNHFLLTPVSAEDLHNSNSNRNFWVKTKDFVWSATGNSASQRANKFEKNHQEKVILEAGLLWQKVTRKNSRFGIQAEITNFVPSTNNQVELMEVTLTNIGNKPLIITPIAAIPIYGRSADNLRDHRNVTSLLHKIKTTTHGIIVKPTLSFDERGHQENDVSYAVFGSDFQENPPVGFIPVVEDFIGEGGSLDLPEAVVSKQNSLVQNGESFKGYEAIGALLFEEISLQPGAKADFRLVLSIQNSNDFSKDLEFLSKENFSKAFKDTETFWQKKLDSLTVKTEDQNFDLWFRWVTLQPILRRIYGCSFLPHHDYGRGGRGWRDLWQDCLALLLMEPGEVRNLLFSNFAGVRIDGSNANIIGNNPGEFFADRNNIPRVWMDHGVWPFLTTKLFVDQSGDLTFLLEEQSYFKDKHTKRCTGFDDLWRSEDGTVLRQENGNEYKGSILEHILVQHLTAFFNVGEHNHILLEGGDWNDGLDMARQRGESVAFTAMYGSNLLALSDLLKAIEKQLNVENLPIAEEVVLLLDTLKNGINYDSIQSKRDLLSQYFDSCGHTINGKKLDISIEDLARDLQQKGNWILEHIRGTEWINSEKGNSWFNGYYDNDENRLEGDHEKGVRMTLTGQAFTLMSGVATEKQTTEIVNAVNNFLWDDSIGGPRLNTNFGEVLMNMGRLFGFAYGHKENGAMFSHMAVMYAYGLYHRGFAYEGYKVLDTIFQHCMNFEKSRIYPGIPEYFNNRGRGMYNYLTGSASWYLYVLLTQSFGVRGHLGDLLLDPKLTLSQFDSESKTSVSTLFADKKLDVIYHNPFKKDFGDYAVTEISINDTIIQFEIFDNGALLSKETISQLNSDTINTISVQLS